MEAAFVFLSAFMVSILAIRISAPIAVKIGLVDKPGGHKLHDGQIPLVGGFAIYMSVFLAWVLAPLLGVATINTIFVSASGMLFVIGLIDDRIHLSVKLRMILQIGAALLLVYSSTVLEDFGYIVSNELFTLGVLSVPLTVFATIGVINAMNMIDGVDGLAGLISLASLSLLLVVSYLSSSGTQLLLILCLMGAISGFLLFNMRWKGRNRAEVFMGDAGSTLLGFLFAFFFISLSQTENRGIAPVVALWLFAVPLMDTVGVMLRRISQRKSPFLADRGHLHHLLLDAGFRARHAVILIALVHFIMGASGLIAYYLGVSESFLFMLFLAVFGIYSYLISRPLQAIAKLRSIHQMTGLTVKDTRQIIIEFISSELSESVIIKMIRNEKQNNTVEIYKIKNKIDGEWKKYAVIDVKTSDNVSRIIRDLKVVLKNNLNINASSIRQYIVRSKKNDRRLKNKDGCILNRRREERRSDSAILIYQDR